MFRYLKRPLLQNTRTLNWIAVDGYQLTVLQVGTFSTEYSLPKLPVPPLDQTLGKYLDTCRPLLTDEQYKCTEEIVARFLKNEGPVLQKLLEERAIKEVNWLSEGWKNSTYLDSRDPVVINLNPGLYLSKQNYKGQREQIEFAARLISGVLKYKLMLDEQSVRVDTMGGKPLCMEQYYNLLNACRIPGVSRDDYVCVGPSDTHQYKHITVIHNNHFFSVDMYGEEDKPLSLSQLSHQLGDCVNHSKEPGVPVGILTSMERTAWGRAHAGMLKEETNRASLESIHTSIFALCLDGPQPAADGDPIDLAASIVLHGGGSHLYSANRWFDKTLQFILSQDGHIGINFEHTVAEGPAVIGLVDHLLEFLERDREPWMTAQNIKPPQQLHFNITSKMREVINQAVYEADSTEMDFMLQEMFLAINNLMLRGLFFKDFGKNLIKKHRLSPDAFIQMAIQLAYYSFWHLEVYMRWPIWHTVRIHKKPCATYEAGSLRKFQLGRTDAIHSCSTASVAFTKGMDDPSMSHSKKLDLLKEAVRSHRKHTNDVVNGKGIDRHLLGLKIMALEYGMNTPELFMDLAFKESTYFRMLTSQVVSKCKALVCFGPDEQDGYGLCYNPQDDELIISISSFNKCPETDSDYFSTSLVKSLRDMEELVASCS